MTSSKIFYYKFYLSKCSFIKCNILSTYTLAISKVKKKNSFLLLYSFFDHNIVLYNGWLPKMLDTLCTFKTVGSILFTCRVPIGWNTERREMIGATRIIMSRQTRQDGQNEKIYQKWRQIPKLPDNVLFRE